MSGQELHPGEEFYKFFTDADGNEKVFYTFCSLHKEVFTCIAESKEDAQKRCEDWLFWHELRGYR